VRHAIFVVDTGYLLAYLDVPGETQPGPATLARGREARNPAKGLTEVQEVQRRFQAASSANDRIVVPLPVIYEVASHINDVAAGRDVARAHAVALLRHVSDALSGTPGRLFEIDPRPDEHDFLEVLTIFAEQRVSQGHSLTDTAVIETADRLKRDSPSDVFVHIWTWERRVTGIRSCSPDTEPNPFPV
jgi:hypothetical protein